VPMEQLKHPIGCLFQLNHRPILTSKRIIWAEGCCHEVRVRERWLEDF
jgi:hypothetical protein